jgi:cystathionine gamma-synthase
MKRDINAAGLGTKALWGGEEQPLDGASTQVPIVQSVSFGYGDLDDWQAVALGQKPGHIYSRNTNPTVAAFEEKVRVLEGAEAATSFASGMAAISNTFFALLRPGDRVVSIRDTYGGTNEMFRDFLPRNRVEVCLCDTTSAEEIEREIAGGCRMLYLETPTNPMLKVVEIARLAHAAHAVGAVVVTDNTFATPINQRPLELGSDLVLHSASKFLGGHADVLGGVVCGPKEWIQPIFHFREITGAALDPLPPIC